MNRDVEIRGRRVVVRAKVDDAIAKVRRMNLAEHIASGKPLSDAQRDLILLALLQASDPAAGAQR